jgi:hypothetical protein
MTVLALACSSVELAGCKAKVANPSQLFDLHASTNPLIPGNILLKLHNRTGEYICIPIAEVGLGSGFVFVEPRASSGFMENRPPPKLLKGLDILGGLYVVPPNEDLDVLLNISDLAERVRLADSVSGVVRGAACKELFQPAAAKLTTVPFQVPVHIRS